MQDRTLRKMLGKHLQDLDGRFGSNMEAKLIYGLGTLVDNQSLVSLPVPGAIPGAGQLPSKDTLRTYLLALIIELTEFAQTLNWKPWKKDQPVDRENVADEFADVLAFLGVVLIQLFAMGFTANDLAAAYRKKSKKNIRRFLGVEAPEYGLVEQEAARQLELFEQASAKE